MCPDSSGEQALLLKNISTEQAVPPEVTTNKQEYKDIKDDISEGSPTRSLDASDGDALLVSKNQGLYFCFDFFFSKTFQDKRYYNALHFSCYIQLNRRSQKVTFMCNTLTLLKLISMLTITNFDF